MRLLVHQINLSVPTLRTMSAAHHSHQIGGNARGYQPGFA